MKRENFPIMSLVTAIAIVTAILSGPAINSLKSILRADDFAPIGGEVYQNPFSLEAGDNFSTIQSLSSRIQAEDRDDTLGTAKEDSETTVGSFENGDWLRFDSVNMDNVRQLNLSVAKAATGTVTS